MTQAQKKSRNTIILAVISAIVSTGLITHFFDWGNMQVKRDDDYIAKYIDCNKHIMILSDDVSKLKAQLTTLELATIDLPFPYWIKDKDSYILYISKAYEDMIMNPLAIKKVDIIGTRGEVFGDDNFVADIIANDIEVMKQGKTRAYRENIPEYKAGTSYKYPLYGRSGIVVGSAGIWIPDNKTYIQAE